MRIITQLNSKYNELFNQIYIQGINGINFNLIYYLETIDKKIMATRDYKRFKLISLRKRELLTINGLIIFKRRYYFDIFNKCYVYLLDHFLGIEPFSRTDNIVKNKVIELITNNSYAKSSDLINPYINLSLSPSTMNSILSKLNIKTQIIKSKKTPDSIYIQIDEKYISFSPKKDSNSNQKHPVFAAVIFEGISIEKNRKKLINRHIITAINNKELQQKIHYFINNRYNIEEIKNTYIYGDGANYIKEYTNHLHYINAVYIPDKFHI